MRDLRAELRAWDDNNPVEWEPTEGDILVGFIRDASSFDGIEARSDSVVIEEERTGISVLVSLDSPLLVALFELHNPRINERVGIKFTGRDTNGMKRFVMVIDRQSASQGRIAQPHPQEASGGGSEAEDDFSGATPEERDYIERMLSAEPSAQAQEGPRHNRSCLKGIISRQEEELSRQTRGLERLEAMISQSTTQTDAAAVCMSDDPADQSSSGNVKNAVPAMRLRRKEKWLRTFALLICIFVSAAGVAGVLLAYSALLLDWWPR